MLGVRAGGAQQGEVVAQDLEAHAFLKEEETKWFARALEAAEDLVKGSKQEKQELEDAIKELSSTIQGTLERAADDMISKAGNTVSLRTSGSTVNATSGRVSMGSSGRPDGGREDQEGVDSDEWDDDADEPLVTPPAPAPPKPELRSAITIARLERQAAEARKASEEDEEGAMREAQLEAFKKALKELEQKIEVQQTRLGHAPNPTPHTPHPHLQVQQNAVEVNKARQAEWLGKVAAAEGGAAAAVPVFPVGDTLLEPFWPQGLGSNRGFHSALDAVWACHVLQQSGLDHALLERNFWYDLVLQGPWQPGLLKPAAGWSADPVTRYANGAILRTKSNYTNPQSKRLFRGEGATPGRIVALDLKKEKGSERLFQ